MAVPRRTLAHLRRLSHQVGDTADATVKTVAASWLQAWDTLSPAWRDGIAALVDQYQRTGMWPALWQVARIEAIAHAQHRTEQTLAVLAAEAATATRDAAAEISRRTVAAEPGIIGSQRGGLEVVAPSKSTVGHTLAARQSRISDLHRPIPAETARTVRQVLARQPAGFGQNTPVAQNLYRQVRAGFDTGLTRAVTVARTETIDTYRTTAGLVHAANARILTGWCWVCSCDLRSCPACWVMHGQQFPLVMPGPEGHAGCRCTRLPLTAGVSLPSAETRFRRLSRRDQIAVFGPGRWELWRTGRAAWADLATRRTNKGWRDSHVPTPVARLHLLAARTAS